MKLFVFAENKKRCLKLLLCLFAVPLAGCQSAGLSNEEIAWQSLHMMDIAQTISAANDPCYVEDAWLTQKLIGSQPNTGEVLLWGVGTAVAHAWISNVLEERGAPVWAQKTWSYATIASTGLAVGNNHSEGVRVFGGNEDVAGCSI